MSSELQDLGRRLVGSWTTDASHPLLPGEALTGTSRFEWMDGERFLIYRTHCDHPDIPDSLSLLGGTDGLQMHYFDTRGVYRLFDLVVTPAGWDIARAKGTEAFAQRMSFRFDEGDASISCTTQIAPDGVTWEDDLEATYRRAG